MINFRRHFLGLGGGASGDKDVRRDTIAKDRRAIEKAGNLHLVHWAVVVMSLLVTFGAWSYAKHQDDAQSLAHFERAADQVGHLVSERMQKYEDGLWGGVSAIQSSGGDISYDAWRTFAETLRIDVKYPGINGIGVIDNVPTQQREAYLARERRERPGFDIHPKRESELYLPITYIEPVETNARAVGLDIAHESNRFNAALRARDTGNAQITGPIILVQDKTHTPGFLFYAPYYAGGVYQTAAERQREFVGLVYAPFVFHKLMEGVLGKDQREVRIRVRDGEQQLYDESDDGAFAADSSSRFSRSTSIDMYGRTWSFDIWATPAFRQSATSNQPTVILIGGIVIDILLLAIFYLLSRANRRAIRLADNMTRELKTKAGDLEASNSELETFAYVAAHDLRAPLRGIGDLTEYIEEDLESYLADGNANPDVRMNLDRLRAQVLRLDKMIKGILDYASLNANSEEVSVFDTKSLLMSLPPELGYKPGTVTHHGEFPMLCSHAVKFQQVMSNLLSNAIKYHHDRRSIAVTVSVSEQDDFYVFSVADNGPGIDPVFHARIFEVFQTLQSRDDIESTGIGLSIVKKVVEQNGGEVWVSSAVGAGATFSFQWPRHDAECAPETTRLPCESAEPCGVGVAA